MSEKKRTALSRREFLKAGVAASAALGLGGAARFTPKVYGRARTTQKMIVLGLDGLDPVLTRRWIDEGRLPAFAKLLRQGDFRPARHEPPSPNPRRLVEFHHRHGPRRPRHLRFLQSRPEDLCPRLFGDRDLGGDEDHPHREDAHPALRRARAQPPQGASVLADPRGRGHPFDDLQDAVQLPARRDTPKDSGRHEHAGSQGVLWLFQVLHERGAGCHPGGGRRR